MEVVTDSTVRPSPGVPEKMAKPAFYEDVESGAPEDKVERPTTSIYTGQGSAAAKVLVWRQDMRIIPLSAAIYLFYLDRSNIGNAKVLNDDTGDDLLDGTNMTTLQYTLALMVFLIAYAAFEVPSNIMLKRMKPSNWIAFLMLCWGALTMGLGGTRSFGSVTTVRFLLGMFEAGLFPGLVYYLTFWYRTEERSIRVALILASATLAGAFGGVIAYGVGHMNGTSGLSAWRWLFILEGLPSLLSSVAISFLLPDYPETANWLSDDEKILATERLRLEGSHGTTGHMTWADAKVTLTDWGLYAHYAIYFGISTPFSSLSLFTPTITAGLGYDGLQAQLMTVPPYAVAYVVTVAVSWSADHFNARGLHSAVFATIGALGFLASAVLPPDAYSQRYGCLIVGASGAFACIPPLLGWLSSNLFSTSAVGLAIAMNISFGAPGQIVGVWIYKADEKRIGYPTGHWTNAGLLFFVAAGCMKAAVVYEAGAPEVLELEQRPVPKHKAGWVLIRIKAFGLNRSELFTRQGHSPGVLFPRILGIEATGLVEEAPGGEFEKGDVLATAMGGVGRAFDGGYAEFIRVPAGQTRKLHTKLSWDVLGGCGEMLQTAYRGTTSVGLAAAAIARNLGVTVVSTTHNAKREELLRSSGASIVVVDDGKIAEEVKKQTGGGVNKVLELVGTTTLLDSLQCTRPHGIVCMAGMVGWELPDFSPMEAIPNSVCLTSYDGGPTVFMNTPLQEKVEQIEKGTLVVTIGKTFRLDKIVEAHRAMEENTAGGKIVVLT
ncbi:hypothetical protein LTR08_008680 [Meristemomyces frigidus]|nr:hypothetical protein LTR08_008680 [Meristemomyces frigidus]